MLHFGTRVLTICPLPGGRLVAHGQSVYPCHEDGIQFGPYLTTALDEVGCDVSLSWVGLGWFGLGSVVVGLGSLVWWASVSVSGGCCAVVGLSYCLERGHVLARVDVVSQLFDSSLHVGF